MPDEEFIRELISRARSQDEGYFQCAHLIALHLDKRLCEQLRQLVNGPVWDGDVICKSSRSELFALGLAVRVCYKGEQGYTGATYLAYSVLRKIDDIKRGKIAA